MDNPISTGKAAKLLCVSVQTLQRWEGEGRLFPIARTDSNRRLCTETQIREFIHCAGLPTSAFAPGRNALSFRLYCSNN